LTARTHRLTLVGSIPALNPSTSRRTTLGRRSPSPRACLIPIGPAGCGSTSADRWQFATDGDWSGPRRQGARWPTATAPAGGGPDPGLVSGRAGCCRGGAGGRGQRRGHGPAAGDSRATRGHNRDHPVRGTGPESYRGPRTTGPAAGVVLVRERRSPGPLANDGTAQSAHTTGPDSAKTTPHRSPLRDDNLRSLHGFDDRGRHVGADRTPDLPPVG